MPVIVYYWKPKVNVSIITYFSSMIPLNKQIRMTYVDINSPIITISEKIMIKQHNDIDVSSTENSLQ